MKEILVDEYVFNRLNAIRNILADIRGAELDDSCIINYLIDNSPIMKAALDYFK